MLIISRIANNLANYTFQSKKKVKLSILGNKNEMDNQFCHVLDMIYLSEKLNTLAESSTYMSKKYISRTRNSRSILV